MDNLPAGAEFDFSAPYNEGEQIIKFDLDVRGIVYYSYQGKLDLGAARDYVRKMLRDTVEAEFSVHGDVDIVHIDISVH